MVIIDSNPKSLQSYPGTDNYDRKQVLKANLDM